MGSKRALVLKQLTEPKRRRRTVGLDAAPLEKEEAAPTGPTSSTPAGEEEGERVRFDPWGSSSPVAPSSSPIPIDPRLSQSSRASPDCRMPRPMPASYYGAQARYYGKPAMARYDGIHHSGLSSQAGTIYPQTYPPIPATPWFLTPASGTQPTNSSETFDRANRGGEYNNSKSSNWSGFNSVGAMDNFHPTDPANASQDVLQYGDGTTGPVGHTGSEIPTTSRGDLISGTVPPSSDNSITMDGAVAQWATTSRGAAPNDLIDLRDEADPTTLGGDATEDPVASRGGTSARGSRGRGRATPRGRGRAYRPVKRIRNRQDEDDDLDDSEEDIGGSTSNKKGKKRQKVLPSVESDDYPVEVHRRRMSLRDRLINGIFEPQNIGMRAHNTKKAAATAATQAAAAPANPRNPPREFLVPVEPREDATMAPVQPAHNTANTIASSSNAAGIQPNRNIAYTSTPVHQLYFPEALVLALKQSLSKWETKAHAESCVFVVLRLVAGDFADMHVFSSLRQAVVDALHMVVSKHPEAFAVVRDRGNDEDDNEVEIKPERSELAYAVLQELGARSAVQLAPVSAHADEPDAEEESLFVIKDEYSDWPAPSRLPGPGPDFAGQAQGQDAPEPTYVFWGKYKVSSKGLNMEAHRADGSAVKVSVHFKNLRKPDHA
ncbi:hypothetical protein ANO14919_143010 [Xylariales sp. No.14919]|nr:hypothetical protein ANO14919_143010 [Xylariales sp. No.14919]